MATVQITNPALAAAADFDLYRVCAPGRRPVFRTRAGDVVDRDATLAAIACGLLGQFAVPERLPDGEWAERLDLSDAGLDYCTRQPAA